MFLCSLYVIYANCTFNDAENFYDITIEPANDIVRKLTQSCENKEREFYIVTKLYNKEEICSIASFLTFLFYDEMKFYKKKYFCYTHCYNEFQFQKEFFLTYIKNYFDVTDDFCQSELFESKWNFGQGTVTSTHVALDVNDEFETKFYNYVTNIDEEQPKEKSGHEKERKIIFISNHKINTVQKLAFYNILKSNEKLGCNLLLIFSIMIEKNIEKEVIYYNLIDNYTRTEYFCQSFGFDFKNFCFFSFYESCKYTDKVFFLKSINCQQEFEKIQLLKISKNTIDNAKHVIYEMYDVKFKMEFFVSKTKIVYVINISYMKWYMEAKFWYIENETTNYNAHFMTLVIGRHDSLVLSSHDNSENNFKFNFKSNLDNVYKYCISHHKFLVTNLQNIIEFPLVCQYLDRSFDNYLDCDYINKYAKSKYIQLQFTDCEKEVTILNVIDYLISNIAQNTNKNEKIYIFKTLLSIKMVENKPKFFYEYCTEETIKNKKIICCEYHKTCINQINDQLHLPYAFSTDAIYGAFRTYEQADNNVLVFMIFLHSGCYVQKYIIAIDFHSYRCKLGDCISKLTAVDDEVECIKRDILKSMIIFFKIKCIKINQETQNRFVDILFKVEADLLAFSYIFSNYKKLNEKILELYEINYKQKLEIEFLDVLAGICVCSIATIVLAIEKTLKGHNIICMLDWFIFSEHKNGDEYFNKILQAIYNCE